MDAVLILGAFFTLYLAFYLAKNTNINNWLTKKQKKKRERFIIILLVPSFIAVLGFFIFLDYILVLSYYSLSVSRGLNQIYSILLSISIILIPTLRLAKTKDNSTEWNQLSGLMKVMSFVLLVPSYFFSRGLLILVFAIVLDYFNSLSSGGLIIYSVLLIVDFYYWRYIAKVFSLRNDPLLWKYFKYNFLELVLFGLLSLTMAILRLNIIL
ncbi:hypothetical protein IPM62_04005 [Candidatus Woesebacteria bacterium]|nr:MAG: hypothetical protein IPM62_04005 [Candidatus Woesebacteria bacterium]